MNYVVSNIIKVVILASLIPVASSIVLLQALPEWRLVQITLHSVFETLGLFASLSVAILLLLLQKHEKLASHYAGISTALVCMGILDGFHAAVPAGNAFVWLHGLAVLSGGFLFAILWFTGHKAQAGKVHVMPICAAVAATGIGALSALFPGIEPQMLREGAFTHWAVSVNVVGGFLFVSASIYFLARYYNNQKKEDILFAVFCFLNGSAGLLFWLSTVWNAEWWFWHLLRVLAYFILLGYIFIIFRRTEAELRETRVKLGVNARINRELENDITEHKMVKEEMLRVNEELELKVAERTRQLLEAQEELLRKEKLAVLGQLSGSVGHELRNPLGVMNNAVFFLKTVLADADDTVKEYLEMLKHEIDNSQRIIADLLDFARTRTPQMSTVMANELVEQSLGRCAIPVNVTLSNDVPEALPPLKVDPLQMGQVLQNLITNAVQAMPDGGALRVAARRLNAECGIRNAESKAEENHSALRTPHSALDADFVEISVEDTGEGISPENMKKLFQPLFTTKARGIGLGLVVCKNLVEANGGRIEVESRVGEGTTFMVLLPVEGEEL